MLIEFRTQNHRSLRDEQVLSLEATHLDAVGVDWVRRVVGYDKELLPVVALYGANASGKTNVLQAMTFMKEAIFFSHRKWDPSGGVPRDPFAFGSARTSPSSYEVLFVFEGVRYLYGFSTDDEKFLEEWLYAWPNKKKQKWFVREGNRFSFQKGFKGENDLISKVTRPNSLFLSAAMQLKHPVLNKIYLWFYNLSILNVNLRPNPAYSNQQSLTKWELMGGHHEDYVAFLLASEQRDDSFHPQSDKPRKNRLTDHFKEFLRSADFGISDVRVNLKIDNDKKHFGTQIELNHKSDAEDSWLSLHQESQGTKTLFRLALPMLRTLDNAGVLLVDELESSLHPSLAREIIRRFNDPNTNPHNAQLIFTTHDTNLMGNTLGDPVLRRDQVWLTEKDDEGATTLYPLTDFKPRKAENLERGYLQGRYGAIPFLGDFMKNLE